MFKKGVYFYFLSKKAKKKMANIKSVYFPDDINEKIKSVDNLSKLINDLLRDYFYKNQTPIEKLPTEVLEKKKVELEQRNYDFLTPKRLTDEELKAIDEELEQRKLTEQEFRELEAKKKLSHIASVKSVLVEMFYVEEEELQELVEMFEIERFNYNSLWDWAIAKGLKEKPIYD